MSINSIRMKLTLTVSVLFIIASLVAILFGRNSLVNLSGYVQQRVEQTLTDTSSKTLSLVTEQAASRVKAFLERPIVTTNTLAEQLNSSASANGGTPYSREQVKAMTLQAMESNPEISAMYAQFEPNGYDRSDAQHRGNLSHSSNVGTLDIYWVNEDGESVYYETEDPSEKYLDEADDLGIREAEWYLCSFDTNDICLLDPYLYEVNEDFEVLMTTYTVPVSANNRFAGLVGIDINLPVIQENIEQLNAQVLDGAGELTVVSQRGLLVASTEFPDQLGNQLAVVSPDLNQFVGANEIVRDQGNFISSLDITFAGVDDTWTVVYRIPEAVILGPMYELKDQMESQSNRAVTSSVMSLLLISILGLVIVWYLINSLIKPLTRVSDMMQELSTNEGDLSQKLPRQSSEELVTLAKGFNSFADKLSEMIRAMIQEKEQLLVVASNMTENGRLVDEQSRLQREKIESIVTAVTEMAASANEVAQLASLTADAANSSNDLILSSQKVLQDNRDSVVQLDTELSQSTEQVGRVAEQTQAIYGILNTIRTIAEQTNLLALNAAIEAARAGEQGRGFAVVADEVRNLAARTQTSTEEVDDLIQGLQKEVDEAVALLSTSKERMAATVSGSEQAYESLNSAVTEVRQINDNATQVSSAATEQSSVSEEISRMVSDVGDAAVELSNLANKTAELTHQTEQSAQSLDTQLSRLKV